MAMLAVETLSKSFRGLRAVADVSFSVEEKGIVALIGPNGAGKTTCFNLIAGAMKPDSGRVRLGGADITGLRADRVCGAGIGRTFQLVKPFQDLTVLENVTVGALHRHATVAIAKRESARILEMLELGDKRHMH
ncbi:MAG: ATP-binding cassette domain-containing protein, partial [Alphaproteobacteria bacterium]